MEWAILHPLRKHSPDGVARARWRTSAYYSSIDLERIKGWVGLVGWTYLIADACFTHISGHPSATDRAWNRESSLVKDRCSTIVQRIMVVVRHGPFEQELSNCWDGWRGVASVENFYAIAKRPTYRARSPFHGRIRTLSIAVLQCSICTASL